jgi:hypothetical protein
MLTGMSVVPGAGIDTARMPEFDDAVADLFDLDVRLDEPDRDPPTTCSADCTNDGCTAATKC